MLTLIGVFVTTFLVLAASGTAIAWGIEKSMELHSWKMRHRALIERENYSAWRSNQRMLIS
jgi:hypothetical protein